MTHALQKLILLLIGMSCVRQRRHQSLLLPLFFLIALRHVPAHQNHRATVILPVRNMQFFSAVYLPAQKAVRNNQIIPLFQFRENMRQF